MKKGPNYFELQNRFWQMYRKHKEIKLGIAGLYGWFVDQFNRNGWEPYMEWQKNELEAFTHLTGKTLTKYREVLCKYNLLRYTKASDNRQPDKYELVLPVEVEKYNGKNSRAKSLANSRAKSLALYKDNKDNKDDSKSVEKENTLKQPNNDVVLVESDGSISEMPTDSKPTENDCINFFLENGSTEDAAKKFYNYYNATEWKKNGDKITNWQSMALYWIRRDSEKKPLSAREKRNMELRKQLITRYGPNI